MAVVPTETPQQKRNVGEGEILSPTLASESVVPRKLHRQRWTVEQDLAAPREPDANQAAHQGQERSKPVRSEVGRLLRATRSSVSTRVGAGYEVASQTLVSATRALSCLQTENH